MERLQIHLLDRDPEVRELSLPVDPATIATPEMQDFFDSLIDAMERYDGIGIAAPQVGHLVRVFVIAKEYAPGGEHLVLINPRIVSLSEKTSQLEEACLSVPGRAGTTYRPSKARTKAIGRDGQPIDIKAKGLLAKILQHEQDHLDAKLYVDIAEDLHPTTSGVL